MGGASDGGESRGTLRSTAGACTDQLRDRRGWLGGLFGRLRRAVTAVSFWVSIPLPFLYVPVLLSGLETRLEGAVFATLVVAHIAFLSLGHQYGTERSGEAKRSRGTDRARSADGRPGD